jgi:hypothetical protein
MTVLSALAAAIPFVKAANSAGKTSTTHSLSPSISAAGETVRLMRLGSLYATF